MRLLERTLQWVSIAPREVKTDALGAQVEGFSEQRRPARASVIPSTGTVSRQEAGLVQTQTLCLLFPGDVDIAPGDGICLGDQTPRWRCVDVQRWSAHCAVSAERIHAT